MGVGLRELARGSWLVSIDMWEWTREWLVEVGRELRGNQIHLLEVCFMVVSLGYSCDFTYERGRAPKRSLGID